ncbi:TLC domain-containing protein 2 [Fasciola gigantica]|uniref:TLC domain-containing protein 2 n=1 Tax=Fasciola gigantica TaxID=46835 RepID=A0A504YG79_FASGI|nr:TLC domain-containing protein 2 [Fasciola gigantica]
MDSVSQPVLKPHVAAFGAFVFFYCTDLILQYLGEMFHTKKPDPYAFNRMRNYSLSVLHALFSGTFSLIYLTVFHELLEDIISAENESAYLVLGFSTGYFIHDIYHNYCSGICLRSAEIIIHHITVVTCFAVVITCRLLLPYALFGLLMELNSIFLHGRQIMLYLNVNPNSLIYRMNANANVGSFVVFRIFLTIGWTIGSSNRTSDARVIRCHSESPSFCQF